MFDESNKSEDKRGFFSKLLAALNHAHIATLHGMEESDGQQFLVMKEGLETASPKGVVRNCQQVEVLTEDDARHALAMIDDRNLAVHTYNEALADILYARLEPYAQIMDRWLTRMEQRANL